MNSELSTTGGTERRPTEMQHRAIMCCDVSHAHPSNTAAKSYLQPDWLVSILVPQLVHLRVGLVVSTPDSESGVLGSNPGGVTFGL